MVKSSYLGRSSIPLLAFKASVLLLLFKASMIEAMPLAFKASEMSTAPLVLYNNSTISRKYRHEHPLPKVGSMSFVNCYDIIM
jgi:hypothetical protein